MFIVKTCGYYYVAYTEKNQHDSELAKCLNMSAFDFQNYLENNFSAVKIAGQMYFREKEDAQKCADWMEPIITMNILVGKNNEQ